LKRALKLGVSILVTLLFSWWAFRETDWLGQWNSLKTANYLWLLPYFGIQGMIHVSRTLRWGCLLEGIEKVPFRKLNEASAIGFMMLIILPFRLGEFARPFLIAQRSNIRRSAAMTTVVLERIVDGLTIAGLLRVLLFFVPSAAPQTRYVKLGANFMFLVFGGGLLFLLFALWQQGRAVRLVRATIGWVMPKAAEKAAEIVDAFVGGMRRLPGRGAVLRFFGYTVGYWALNGLGMMVLSMAFEGARLSPFQGYVVLSVLVVGLMIPAAPGMMGTFQAALRVGLMLFLPKAVVDSTGQAYANVMWLCQTVQQVGLGLVMLSLTHVSFSDLAGRLNQEAQVPPPEPTIEPSAGAQPR
jgi:glycosyltransferase 2 family protein